MAGHPWDIERLDLDAYLTRIGVVRELPSRSGLDRLLEAHVRTFTFDNIDVLLDQHPGGWLTAAHRWAEIENLTACAGEQVGIVDRPGGVAPRG